jgi:hypothetical protein
MRDELIPELADKVAGELAAGESIVWAGQPRLDLATRPAWFLVPFGIVFTGFSLLWMAIAALMTVGLLAPCGLPFVVVGIGLMASPAWLRSLARKTVYLLTDRRAIIWRPSVFGRVSVQSFTAAGLGQMTRNERPDGAGDLVFQVSHSGFGENSRTETRGFLAIDNVRHVEDLVRSTLLTNRESERRDSGS